MLLDRVSQHSFLPNFIATNGVVLDLGFNRGQFSYEMIDRYNSRVFAIEPVKEFCEAAVANPSLTLTNAAVLANSRTVKMLASEDRALSASVLDNEVVSNIHDTQSVGSIEIDGVTLEQVIASTGVTTIELVKMDIEGAELEVLNTISEETLGKIKQIAVEFHDFWYPELSEETEKVKERLRRHGFDMIRFTPNNKDVLFINSQHVSLGTVHRFWVAHVLRNVNGFGRMLLIGLRKVGLAK